MLALVLAASAAPCTLDLTVSGPVRPGVPVLVERLENFQPVESRQGWSDGQGALRFEDLSPGVWMATAIQGDLLPGTMKRARCVDGDALSGELSMQDADAWLDVRLVDSAGASIRSKGGSVGIVDLSGGAVFLSGANVPAPGGEARIGVLAGHRYRVFGMAPGFRFGSAEADGVAGEELTLPVKLVVAPQITGRAVGPDGAPIAGAAVHLFPVTPGEVRTDADGRFSIESVPGTENRVSVLKDNLVGTAHVGHIREGDETPDIELTLETGRRVEGQVVDVSGKGVGPIRVVWGAGGTGLLVSLHTDDEGYFVAEGLPQNRDQNGKRRWYESPDIQFFVHDEAHRTKLRKVVLRPGETTIEVPFELDSNR